jgi:hypothetical protein
MDSGNNQQQGGRRMKEQTAAEKKLARKVAVNTATDGYKRTVQRLWEQYEDGLISQVALQYDIAGAADHVRKIVALQIRYEVEEVEANCEKLAVLGRE